MNLSAKSLAKSVVVASNSKVIGRRAASPMTGADHKAIYAARTLGRSARSAWKVLAMAVAAAGSWAAVPATVSAADRNWGGDVNSTDFTWNTTDANWYQVTSGTTNYYSWNNAGGDGAIISVDYFNPGGTNFTLSEPISAHSLKVLANGVNFSGAALTLTATGTSTAGTFISNFGRTLQVDAQFADLSGNFTTNVATFNNKIVATSGLIKTGSGIAILNASNNIITGNFVVNTNLLQPSRNVAADLVVGDPTFQVFGFGGVYGTLKLGVADAIAPSTRVALDQLGKLDIGNFNVTLGALIFPGKYGSAPAWTDLTKPNIGVIGTGTLKVTGDITACTGNSIFTINGVATNLDLGGGTQIVRTSRNNQIGPTPQIIFSGVLSNGNLLSTGGSYWEGNLTTPQGIALLGNNTYVGTSTFNGGTTTVTGTNASSFVRAEGSALILQCPNGSYLGAGSILAAAGGSITLDNVASFTSTVSSPSTVGGANSNRISDTAAVTLRDAGFSLVGPSGSSLNETIGSLNASYGNNTIRIYPSNGGTGVITSLTVANSLTIGSTATILFTSTAAGTVNLTNALGGNARLLVNGTLPTSVGGIVQRVATPTDFVKYDVTTGFTPLSTSDYSATIANGAQTSITTAATLFSSASPNSIRLTGGTPTLGLQPGTTLSLTSGMVLAFSTATYSTSLVPGNFYAAGSSISGPGVISVGATPLTIVGSTATLFQTPNYLHLNAPIKGTAGMIIAGPTVRLSGDQSGLTGQITVNSGSLLLSTDTFKGPIQVRTGASLSILTSISGSSPITIGSPENDSDLYYATPSLDTRVAPVNSVIGRPFIFDNGGRTFGGVIGSTSAITIQPLHNFYGSQTFSGDFTLNSPVNLQTGLAFDGVTSPNNVNGATVFTGNISGPGTFYLNNGRAVFAGTYSQTGGFNITGGNANQMGVFFTGTSGPNVPLLFGSNNQTVTFTGSAALPSGIINTTVTGGGVLTLVPLQSAVLSNTIVANSNIVFAPPANTTTTLTGTITTVGNASIGNGGLGALILPNNPAINVRVASGTLLSTDTNPVSFNVVTVAGTGTVDLSLMTTPLTRSTGQIISMENGLLTGGTITGTGTLSHNISISSANTNLPIVTSYITGQTTVSATGVIGNGFLFQGQQAMTLTATNDYSGPTNVTYSTLRGVDGVNISPNSLITLNGGLIESSGTFTRSLGTGPGQLNVIGGPVGFSAYGGPLSVSIGGSTLTTLSFTGATPNFITTGPTNSGQPMRGLVLNGPTANDTVTLNNAIDIGSDGSTQTISVFSGTAVLAGPMSGGSSNTLLKIGSGTLVVTGSSSFIGTVRVAGGTLRATDGVGLNTSSNLALQGLSVNGAFSPAIFQTAGTFSRTLGGGFGQVSIPNVSSGNPSGFDAYSDTPGTKLVLQMVNPTAPGGDTNRLKLNDTANASLFGTPVFWLNTGATANGAIEIKNDIDVNNLRSSVFINNFSVAAGFTINVGIGNGAAGVGTVTMTGSILDSGFTNTNAGGNVTKYGAGQLILNGTSTSWTGGTSGTVVAAGGTLTLGVGSALIKPKLINITAGTFDPTPNVGATGTYSLTGTQIIQVTNVSGYNNNGNSNPFVGNYGGAGTVTFGGGSAAIAPTLLYSVSANLVGSINVTNNVTGVAALNGLNTYSGPTTLSAGSLRFSDVSKISPNSLMVFRGGYLQTSGTYSAPLGGLPGNASVPSTTTLVGFDGWNATPGVGLTVSFGGGTQTILVNNSAGSTNTFFGATTLALNNGPSNTANAPVIVTNPIDLNGKTLTVTVGTGTPTGGLGATATLSGTITSSTANAVLIKNGLGRLVLSGTGSGWTGGSIAVTGGTLAIASGASISKSITLAGGGSLDAGSLFTTAASQTIAITHPTSTLTGSLAGLGTVSFLGSTNVVNGTLITTPTNIGGSVNILVSNTAGGNWGTATLTGVLSTTGTTTVSGAFNRLVLQSALKPAVSPLNVTGSNVSVQFSVPTSSNTYTRAGEFSAINISNGNAAVWGPTGTIGITATDRTTQKASVLVANTLDLGTFGSGVAGFIDVGNNDMIIRNGSLTAITNAVKTWLNGGSPISLGIGSTVAGAGTGLTTLAVFSNDAGGGIPYYTSYDGVVAADGVSALPSTAVIVKYAYYGDANIDGVVDGKDLKITMESAIVGGRTGWNNGDFNYDGVVDAADLSKLLAVLNTSGLPSLGSGQESGGEVAAIPEPASASLVLMAAPLMTRRRRR
jgi:autotransporter-associated beta strand protein